MGTRQISVLITDLDNTLFDWVDIWHKPFRAMLDEILKISELKEEQLLPEIREIHQRHGTSEYAFLIGEIPSLKALHPDGDLNEIYNSAIHIYRKVRKDVLRLYPGVLETLVHLKGRGVLIVGYTESMAFYSNFRVKRLGLDGVIDFIYSPEDHDVPKNVDITALRKNPSSFYDLLKTVHRHTPKGELKPNPDVLRKIISDVGAKVEECIYVGDSKMKDVAMAQDVGVADVWAKYGGAQHKDEYGLLRAVSHWSEDDVSREMKILESGGGANPSHVLQASFAEVLSIFDFIRFTGGASFAPSDVAQGAYQPLPASMPIIVEAWKKIVDVQQHFNDLELRIRNLFITVMAAIISAGAVVFQRKIGLHLGDVTISLSLAIILVGMLAVQLFHFMDRHWYHRLLVGAVKQAIFIEGKYKTILPEISLSASIGDESPKEVKGKFARFIIGIIINDERFSEKHVLHSDAKVALFYKSVMAVLIVMLLGLSLVGGVKIDNESLLSISWAFITSLFRCVFH